MSGKPPVILLAGPTASGKTSLAIRLAKALDGEVINADSMQIYADLQILSARPTEEEQDGIPHHLFGVVDAATRASVGWWAREVLRLIEEVEARGKRPILAGGTGLYFNALVKGLADMPDISEAARQAAEALEDRGMEALREKAIAFDPDAAARIAPSDKQRLRRIVEIGLETGQPISAFQKETRPLLAADRHTGLVIEPDRADLYERIERRFGQMVAAGAMEEARRLADRGLDPVLPAMKALGVPPLIAASLGETSLQDAIVQAKQDSRRYAKRQMTWFRNQMPDWQRIDPAAPDRELLTLL
ncbi:tRNA (adenosine(37)-N6)-dimethylallyltransferase MiaA [Hyphobacterium sp.]|uniref:tRNA (adenosine(37)-N6)-dimethylallyltransferase MiaA n=1 Tax=Hyphobacterium sp. TaxID=2004662 RepID=UPI003BAD7A3F